MLLIQREGSKSALVNSSFWEGNRTCLLRYPKSAQRIFLAHSIYNNHQIIPTCTHSLFLFCIKKMIVELMVVLEECAKQHRYTFVEEHYEEGSDSHRT